ncbi:hypothetical protein BH09SUM1_BH09SUM1_12800 [soil metagenome]
MIRKIVGAGLVVLLASEIVSASSLGLATSRNAFSLSRSGAAVSGVAEKPLLVNLGDEVQSGEGMLRIDGLTGETILLDAKSAATLAANDRMRLKNGNMVVSMPSHSKMAVDVQNLSIEPMEASADGKPSAIAVGSTKDNEIEMLARGRMYRVRSMPAGNQVAVLGASDALKFVKDSASGEWAPAGPLMQSDDPTAPEEDDDDHKKGLIPFLRNALTGGSGLALGIGAVAVGATVVTVNDITKPKKHPGNTSNDRPSTSAIDPTPTEPTPSATASPTPTAVTPTPTEPSPTPTQSPVPTDGGGAGPAIK